MRLDDRALLDRQPAGLREDVAGDADLADVVEQRSELEPLQRGVVETQLGADAEREIRDPARMLRRVLVVRLERVRKRLDRGHERALEPFVAAGVRDRELRLVGDAAEQPQLALAELVGVDLGEDGAGAALDLEPRDGVGGTGRDRIAVDPRDVVRGHDERVDPVVHRTRLGGPDAAALDVLALLRAVPVRRARDEPAFLVLEPDAGARRAENPGATARRRGPGSLRARTRSRARGRSRAARSRSRPRGARPRTASRSRRRRRRGRRAPRAGGRRPRRTGRARASRRRSRRPRASRSGAAPRAATPRSPACPGCGCRTRSSPRRR